MRADGELSELEGALLEAHLKRCRDCHEFAVDVSQITTVLRAAPLEPLERTIVLPRRRRIAARALPTAAAAAVVLGAVGLGSLTGVLRSDGGNAPRPPQLSQVVAFEDSADAMRLLRRPELIIQGRGRIPRNHDLGDV